MGSGTRMRRTTSASRFGALVVSVTLIAAACGDDGDDPEDTAGSGDPDQPDVVYPGEEWEVADPEAMGFDPDKLQELADEAEANDSHCVVVTRDGQIVDERYWGEDDATTQHEAFSATKSYASSLVGLAIDETDLELDDKASDYIEDWVGTDSEDVTVRNLLSNDSGRAWMSALGGFQESYVDLTAAEDRSQFAMDLGQDQPPGEFWEYNDAAIQTLEPILSEVTGMDPADYAQEKIFEPIGATQTEMTSDAAGNTAMYFELKSTCRDLARYGYLFLQDGVWDGEQVMPEGWVQEATGQPSQELSANYGFLWWLNRPGASEQPGGGGGGADDDPDEADRDIPEAPEDMYWARGLGGQIIQIDPGSGTVVTRMGTGDIGATYGSGQTARYVTEAFVD